MRVAKKKLDPALREAAIMLIASKAEKISSPADMEKFLNSFFAKKEIDLILKKAAVMVLLSRNAKYRDICETLEVSKNTISKVRSSLAGKEYWAEPEKKREKNVSFSAPKKKKKYPLKYKGATPIHF